MRWTKGWGCHVTTAAVSESFCSAMTTWSVHTVSVVSVPAEDTHSPSPHVACNTHTVSVVAVPGAEAHRPTPHVEYAVHTSALPPPLNVPAAQAVQ